MPKDNLTNLVEEYRNGNVSVFDELYNRTINDMYRYARKLTSDDSIIEDAIQDSYIKMADSIESLRDSSSFLSWGYTILRNNINSAYRKNKKLVAMPVAVDSNGSELEFVETLETNDSESLPGEEMDRRETEQIIRNTLYKLPETQRQTLTYFYFDEMSIRDIALFMECSEGTVKSRLSNGREKLRLAITAHEEVNGYRLHALLNLPLITSALKATDLSIALPLAKSNTLLSCIKATAKIFSHTSSSIGAAGTTKVSNVMTGVGKKGSSKTLNSVLSHALPAVIVTTMVCSGVLFALASGGEPHPEEGNTATSSSFTDLNISADKIISSNDEFNKKSISYKNKIMTKKDKRGIPDPLSGNSEVGVKNRGINKLKERSERRLSEEINPLITSEANKPLKPEKPLTPGTSGEGHTNLSPASPFTSPILPSNIISSGKGKFTSNGKISFITRPDKSYSILKISENGVEEVWASLGTEVDSILIDKNILYFTCNSADMGFLVSMDINTANTKICYKESHRKLSDLAYHNGLLYFRSNANDGNSDELALNPNLSNYTGSKITSENVNGFESLSGAYDGRIYGIKDGKLKSLNLANGEITSFVSVESETRIITTPRALYFTMTSAFDPMKTGLKKYDSKTNSFSEILQLPTNKANLMIEGENDTIICLSEKTNGKIELFSQKPVKDAERQILFDDIIPIPGIDTAEYQRTCYLLGSDLANIYVATSLKKSNGSSRTYLHAISRTSKKARLVSEIS